MAADDESESLQEGKTPPAPVRYFSLTVRGVCEACGQPLPLDGLKLLSNCPYCLTDNTISLEVWESVLGTLIEQDGELAVGEEFKGRILGQREAKYTIARVAAPTCDTCLASDEVEPLGVGHDQDFVCSQCGAPAGTQTPPSWALPMMKGAKQLYFSDAKVELGGVALEAEAEIKPVVMACPQCGGSLAATVNSERILGCRYCQAEVYLPDTVWRRLHPIVKSKPFFVRLEGATRREQRAASKERGERARNKRLGNEAAELKERAEQARHNLKEREAAAQAETQAKVQSATTLAWIGALAFFGLVCTVQLLGSEPFRLTGRDFRGLLAVPITLCVVGVLVTRPIKIATKRSFDWMLFRTWSWIPIGMILWVGPVFALVQTFIHFRGKFGPTMLSRGPHSSEEYYPAIALENGEGRPAALAFFTIATWGFPDLWLLLTS